ncbi:MAG: hypothetical protein KKC01_05115 [Gammaproteobacteria bacterium]|nr:hypothetical protein [Gammaproteobacteria bacterium]
MTSVTFWNNNNYGGISSGFSSAQRRTYTTSEAWDSLKTGSNSWLVVWDQSDCSGQYLKFGPNASNSDLNKTDRGNDGDWKNQIKSFVLYASQPRWWNDGSAPPSDDLNLAASQAMFCSDQDFFADAATVTAETDKSDLNSVLYPTDSNRDMKDNISALATGTSAYLEIWNDTGYSGDYLRVKPNSELPDLNNVMRLPDGDWNNQMQSFKLHASPPDATWNLGFDQDKFFAAYPNSALWYDSSGPYYRYTSQDCSYDIRITAVSFTSSSMTLSFRIDYELAGHNDKVNLDLQVDPQGAMEQITYEYEQGGAVQIPDSVIKAVDVSAEVLGAVGALETAGISEEAANSFIEAFDTFCNVFNKVSNGLYKLSESNDGRFYLAAVGTHTLARALSAIEVAGNNPVTPSMSFSRSSFASQLNATDGISIDGGASNWTQWTGTAGSLNQLLSYSRNGFNYRSWSPESSTYPTDLGLVVSCKIDFANGIGDDHIILIVGFLKVADATPTINFVQASVQFYNDDDQNIMIDPIISDPNDPLDDIGQALYDALDTQVQAANFGDDSTSEGRKSLPAIAQINLNAMNGTVST